MKRDGMLAVWLVGGANPQLEVREGILSATAWGQIFEILHQTMVRENETQIRAHFGNCTVSLLRDENKVVGVVTIQAHPIIKSTQRAMRRTLRGMPPFFQGSRDNDAVI